MWLDVIEFLSITAGHEELCKWNLMIAGFLTDSLVIVWLVSRSLLWGCFSLRLQIILCQILLSLLLLLNFPFWSLSIITAKICGCKDVPDCEQVEMLSWIGCTVVYYKLSTAKHIDVDENVTGFYCVTINTICLIISPYVWIFKIGHIIGFLEVFISSAISEFKVELYSSSYTLICCRGSDLIISITVEFISCSLRGLFSFLKLKWICKALLWFWNPPTATAVNMLPTEASVGHRGH